VDCLIDGDADHRVRSAVEDGRDTDHFVALRDARLGVHRPLDAEPDPVFDVVEREGKFDEHLGVDIVVGGDDDDLRVAVLEPIKNELVGENSSTASAPSTDRMIGGR